MFRRPSAGLIASLTAVLVGVLIAGSLASFVLTVPAHADEAIVWGWGDNAYGQLGDNTMTSHSAPVSIARLSHVADIAASDGYSIFLTEAATVQAAGSNAYGRLGTGGGPDTPVPVTVPGLTEVTAVAAGTATAMALRADGTVWVWGDGSAGQLGDGRFGDGSSGDGPSGGIAVDHPQQVPGLSGVTAIAAGGRHMAALRTDGTVWTWGSDVYGELGRGKTGDLAGCVCNPTPAAATGLSGAIAVTAAQSKTGALTAAGGVYAWGSPETFGSVFEHDTPTQITGIPAMAQISQGFSHTLALARDGTVWSWGVDLDGQLGDGTAGSVINAPKAVPGLTGVTAVRAYSEFSAAVTSGGTLTTWGNNQQGQLGLGRADPRATTPTVVPELPATARLSTGGYAHHMFAQS